MFVAERAHREAARLMRTKNAAPNTRNVSSSAEFKCFFGGKNFVASSGARKPKSAKSYHSSALPTVVAATTQTSRRVVGAAISPVDCRSSWCRRRGGDGGASESSSSTSMLTGAAGTRVGMIVVSSDRASRARATQWCERRTISKKLLHLVWALFLHKRRRSRGLASAATLVSIAKSRERLCRPRRHYTFYRSVLSRIYRAEQLPRDQTHLYTPLALSESSFAAVARTAQRT